MADDDNEDKGMRLTLALPDGDEFELDPDVHLTASIFRHVKGWYPNLDIWQQWPFRNALGWGEPNAAACALWIARRYLGIKPNPEPNRFAAKIGDPTDFAVGRFVLVPNRPPDAPSPRWLLRPEDEEYELSLDDDLMCSHLRLIQRKARHLPTMNAIWAGLIQGDPDAVAWMVWVARSKENVRLAAENLPLVKNPFPEDMEDFAVSRVSPFENIERLNDESPFVEPPSPTTTGNETTDVPRLPPETANSNDD